MKFRDNASGIALPVEKPQPPEPPKYGPLEIQDETARSEAGYLLSRLALAMKLEQGNGCAGIRTPDQPSATTYEAHWQLWHYTAKMLLGEDAPEIEVLT